MKKAAIGLLAAVMLIFGNAVWAQAESSSYTEEPPGLSDQEQAEEFLEGEEVGELTDLIPPSARKLMPDTEENIGDMVKSFTPQSILKKLWQTVENTAGAPLRMLASLVGIIILCAVLSSFNTSLGQSGVVPIFNVIICVFISSIIIDPIVECIVDATAAIREFSLFILTFIPVFAGVVTAAGQPMTGAAYNLFVFWMCQITSQVITGTFVPLLCGYLAMSLISVVCPEMHLGEAVTGIRTFVTWSLTLILTVFVGLLTIQSVVAASGDSVAIKTTKFFIGSLVPVVGGALSDMFVAAQGCIQLVKGTVGAFGVAITAMTFLPILLRTAVWYTIINLGGIISGLFGVQEISKLLKVISSTLGILTAVLLYYALLVIISTTILIVAFRGG